MSLFNPREWISSRSQPTYCFHVPFTAINTAARAFTHEGGRRNIDINACEKKQCIDTHSSATSPSMSTCDILHPFITSMQWSPDGTMMMIGASNNKVVITSPGIYSYAYHKLLNNPHAQHHPRHHHQIIKGSCESFDHSLVQQHTLLRPPLAMTWLPLTHRLFLDESYGLGVKTPLSCL